MRRKRKKVCSGYKTLQAKDLAKQPLISGSYDFAMVQQNLTHDWRDSGNYGTVQQRVIQMLNLLSLLNMPKETWEGSQKHK